MSCRSADNETRPLLQGRAGATEPAGDAQDDKKQKHFNLVGLSPAAFWALVSCFGAMYALVTDQSLADDINLPGNVSATGGWVHHGHAAQLDLFRVLLGEPSPVAGHGVVSLFLFNHDEN